MSESLNVDAFGRVGIGLTSQEATLAVQGACTVALSGSVSISSGSTAVVGSGTSFSSELSVGSVLCIGSESFRVAAIHSADMLDVEVAAAIGSTGAPAYREGNVLRLRDGLQHPLLFVTRTGELFLNPTSDPLGLICESDDPQPFVANQQELNVLLRNRNTASGSHMGIQFAGDGNQFAGALLVEKEGGNIGMNIKYALSLWTTDGGVSGAGERLRITPEGAVGIGTSNPSFELEVAGSAGKPGGGSWSVASDRRLKKNVATLDGALEKLLSLRGVTFEYRDPESLNELAGERVGFIAQEVEEFLPDWVEEADDGYKRLTVRGFEALAVEALRELQKEKDAEIAALRDTKDAQAEEIAQLRADLDELREALGVQTAK